MRNGLITIVGLACVFLLSACAGKKISMGDQTKVSKGPVTVYSSWVKDKGKKYDVQFHIANEGQTAFIIMLNDITCWRGNTRGELKHTFFNTGERTIDIRAGQQKTMNLVCNHHNEDPKGGYSIQINKVYDNPGGDGVTRGKVIANDIEWRVTMTK